MKKSFYVGLFLGIFLTGCAFFLREHFALQFHSTPPSHKSKGHDPDPQWWLLPKDTTLAKIYTEPDAVSILAAPDTITIHRAISNGNISVQKHRFDSKGVVPSPDDSETLVRGLNALNAYTLPSACGFQPGVLVRLTRGDHRLDLLVCFSCEDIAWVLDGKKTSDLAVGLSDLGIGTLRSVLRRSFPKDPAFEAY